MGCIGDELVALPPKEPASRWRRRAALEGSVATHESAPSRSGVRSTRVVLLRERPVDLPCSAAPCGVVRGLAFERSERRARCRREQREPDRSPSFGRACGDRRWNLGHLPPRTSGGPTGSDRRPGRFRVASARVDPNGRRGRRAMPAGDMLRRGLPGERQASLPRHLHLAARSRQPGPERRPESVHRRVHRVSVTCRCVVSTTCAPHSLLRARACSAAIRAMRRWTPRARDACSRTPGCRHPRAHVHSPIAWCHRKAARATSTWGD